MENIFRDSIWQFVGVLVSIFFGLLALRKTSKKGIIFEFVYQLPEIHLRDYGNWEGQVEVFLNGEPITYVSKVDIRIHNNGDMPVVKSDYEKPLCIIFNENARIIRTRIRDSHPKYNNLALESTNNIVIIDPFLFNPKEYYTLSFLIDNYKSFQVDGHIVGGSIRRSSMDFLYMYYRILSASIGLVAIFIYFSSAVEARLFLSPVVAGAVAITIHAWYCLLAEGRHILVRESFQVFGFVVVITSLILGVFTLLPLL